ncbi:MAG: hypothetical protein KatS3mg111_1590 [Pirellulaceae bacterium]|nr:MAG: hypothetical protein KatS3mg111_1590 [Pirellulaceae bacterium]
MAFSDGILFCKQFLANPRQVGAIWPSSRHLARCMVEWIEWERVSAVMEVGPGTGVFTEAILHSAGPDTRCIALEINAMMAQALRQRFETVQVHTASVAEAPQICQRVGVDGVDAVLSGLPWAVFSQQEQQEMLDAIVRVMRTDGQFCTFAYLQGLLLPAARKFRRLLESRFPMVETSPIVWRNLPPAIVYRCRLAGDTRVATP